ncbi:MAG: lysylphosphatidylglycerol synthase domain-containing protein [Aliidongia sp.]
MTKSGFIARFGGPALTLGLMAGAAYLLYRSLKDVELWKLWRALHDVPPTSIATALGLTALSYLALTSYDYIGVRYVKLSIAYWRVAIAAFTAYSISHSLGFPAVTGGTVRYRLYSRWGCNAVEVAQIMAMAGITLFLGMFTIGGIALLLDGARVKAWTGLPSDGINALGVLSLGVVAAYGLISFVRREPLQFLGYRIAIPSPRFAAIQIAISGIDWLVVASVLYVLLPPNDVFTFPTFLGVFVLAYLLGTLSNVPGGLGVFESIILITMQQSVPTETIISSLLVYRGVYHLVPLMIGGSIFLVSEFRRSHPKVKNGPAPRPLRRAAR